MSSSHPTTSQVAAARLAASWLLAYPETVFPKPDWDKAARVLADEGMTLDAVSAANYRHVLCRVLEKIDEIEGGE